MSWLPIIPPGSAPPLAPYVPGTRATGDTVYVSGTLAMDAGGNIIGLGDAHAQTRSVIESIRNVLLASGADLGDVAYNMIFIKDREHYAAMNEVYREYFGVNPPARYCLICELVKPEFLVEISSIAHIKPSA